MNARAYTLGTDVVFGAGGYAPRTPRGAGILAHELAHVVQQDGKPPPVDRPAPIGSESDPAERAAHAAARAVMSPYRSTALGIRAQLRAAAPRAQTIQRITTWAGEFDTTKYTTIQGPPMDGVDIELEFRPNDKVDAKRIGMVQSVISAEKGKPFLIGTAAQKAVYKQRAVAAGETGEGRRIDRATSDDYGNPLYATDVPGAKDRLGTTATVADWGHHGWRYIDAAGKERKKNALLKDTPKLSNARVESAQRFETTALAVRGAQSGTYYGSVSWGWEKNAAGLVRRLPLTRVSKDAPSGAFTAAARKWNTSQTIGGKDTINLPIVPRMYARADDTVVVAHPTTPGVEVARLTKNTRMEITRWATNEAFNRGSSDLWRRVTIVDGPDAGKVGWLQMSQMSNAPSP